MKPMNPTSMEPMVPAVDDPPLDDVVFELTRAASSLAGQLHPHVQDAMGALVRSMNCYYSNLIEGHDTRPRDIERALKKDYASEPKKRDLQLEAEAHISVQAMIDAGNDPKVWPATLDYALWLHLEFCNRLPASMLVVTNPDTNERIPVIPGQVRSRDVAVGHHEPPPHGQLPAFMARFDAAYSPGALSKPGQLRALPAAHHRLLWIHPFLDGNGRVARLMSHALFKRLGLGSSLWSVSRGLARQVSVYKSLLQAADAQRQGDLDGRGNLSAKALTNFSVFFLETCLDQVRFMSELLQPGEILPRMEAFAADEVRAKRLPPGAYPLLREAWLEGELRRDRIPSVLNLGERASRLAVAKLVGRGLLTARTHKSPLRLAFPVDVVERWLPRLYPVG